MIKEQLRLLRTFERHYGKNEAENIITWLNNFTMLTADQVTEKTRAELKRDIAEMRDKMVNTILIGMGVATAIISIVIMLK